jgi:virulence-associated protein VagC
MITRAKILLNGLGPVIRFPKAFKFPHGATEVLVRHEGRRLIIEPAEQWSPAFLAALGAWHEGDIPRPGSAWDTEPLRDPFDR